MDCCQNNMSMISTRNNNVSIFVCFVDTFSRNGSKVNLKGAV